MKKLYLEEDSSLEKIPIPPRESFFQTTVKFLLREFRLIGAALNSAFADPILLMKYIFWPKSLDRGIRPEAQWFEVKPEKSNGVGLLLCHGFASTPEMYREIAPKLAESGYHVRVIRLSGHGTTPGHLAQTSGAEWFASVVWHYQIMEQEYDRIFFLGHSLGGTLGLLLATIYPIDTVIAMCSPIELNIPPARFVRQASIFVKYWPRSRKRRKFIKEMGTQTYLVTPLYAIAGIFEVGTILRKRSENLKIPVLYISARQDHKSLLDQPDKFLQYFPKLPITIKNAEKSPHTLLYGPEKEMITSWIIEWFENH